MQRKQLWLIGGAVVLVLGGGVGTTVWWQRHQAAQAVQAVATRYTKAFAQRDYAKMAKLVTPTQGYTAKTLIARNQAVFSRLGASHMTISRLTTTRQSARVYRLRFTARMRTVLGQLPAQHYLATIQRTKGHWRVRWTTRLLLPAMQRQSTLQLTTTPAVRGQIFDRDNEPLAKNGTVTEAGLVPRSLGTGTTQTARLTAIAKAWSTTVAALKQLLGQSWVTKDTFVPVKVVKAPTVLPGAAYQAKDARTYPLGAAAAQLIGYVGPATAADIKANPVLTAASVVGKAGLERRYDRQLRGQTGGKLTIVTGKHQYLLLAKDAADGTDLHLTIAATAQRAAYQRLAGKPGSVVTMAPITGELLTLVSSPSYDPNAFVTGISQADYDRYAKNAQLPFVSRFTQRYAPGSTFKLLTAGIALANGTITTQTTKTISGLKWQPNASWGQYFVTRTVAAGRENMTQALVNSDNIWFAQVALQMGQAAYLKGLAPFFATKADLPLTMKAAQLSNSDKLASATLLADTAYGQGQLLLSPIQQAALYSAIANAGTLQQPTLIAGQAGKRTAVLKASAANAVKTALTHVVSDAAGTAHGLQLAGHTIAAKTGTAELKQQQDTTGKTNGFLVAMDADDNTYLTVAMLENAGSDAVVTALKPYLASLY